MRPPTIARPGPAEEPVINAMDTLFSVREVARIFALKESRLRYWAQTGFINPSGRKRGRRAYTFADLVEIKAAKELLEAGVSLQRVRKNLQALRKTWPDGARGPLSRMRVRSDGDNLIVAEDDATFNPLSGQTLLDFEVAELREEAALLVELKPTARPTNDASPTNGPPPGTRAAPPVPATAEPHTAYEWFMRGCAFDEESGRLDDAVQAYRRAIELDPTLAAAHTNLGNVHFRQQEREAARRCYETACALDPDQAEARYNLANIYEEDGDLDMAIAEYRRALSGDPDFADAHFNLALTLEQVGSQVQAREHWRRYLDLVPPQRPQQPWRRLAEEHLQKLEEN